MLDPVLRLGLLLLAASLAQAASPDPAPPTPAPANAPVVLPPVTTLPPDNSAAKAPASTPVVAPEEPPAPEPTPAPVPGGPKFIGALTCSSSLCHGGGGNQRDAYTIWNKSDPHEHAVTALAGERAARIAQGLALASTESTRCTVCHAPLETVPTSRVASAIDAKQEGVSCESCHGPAQNWLRSHTRLDFTHAQNVQTGIRDLRNLYVRANTCVACHQVLEPDLLRAGHPPLTFELETQTVAEPRHWVDQGDYFGPQAWLVGQAAALRETSWSLHSVAEPLPAAREQWRALVWLLQRATAAYGGALPKLDAPNALDFSAANVARAQQVADDIARAGAHLEWSRASTERCLNALAGTRPEFVPGGADGNAADAALALQSRAQRLALALERLMTPLQRPDDPRWSQASGELDKLFDLANVRAVFDANAFAEQLERFAKTLPIYRDAGGSR